MRKSFFRITVTAYLLLCWTGSAPFLGAEETEPKKKVSVLITGANRGLGLELAKHFAADGYQVYGTARKPEAADDLKATGATVIKLDVSSEKDIAAMAKSLEGRPIDILINNAGYFGPKLMTENPDNIETLTREEMRRCYEVNTMGPLFVTKALLPNLRLSEFPKVINMSTRASILGGGTSGKAYGYRVSKAGLNMVTRTMAGDKGMKGFLVVSLAPGHNKTTMGTEWAKLDPVETMGKFKKLIESLKPEHHGRFLYYDGKKLPW